MKSNVSRIRTIARSIPGARKAVRALRSLRKGNRLDEPRLRHAADASRSEVGPDGLPVPPAVMRHWVAGGDDRAWFLGSGERGAKTIHQTLEKQALTLDRFEDVLDFGCGCGRIIRYLKPYRKVRLHGTDCNPQMITWCDENLEFVEFGSNKVEPPLRYRDGSFDLVYAFSIFTHLSVPLQRPWMEELRRVIKPGGYLLLSLHGDSYLKNLEGEEAALYRSGNLVVRGDDEVGKNVCFALHPERYVRTVFSQGFEVLEFIPEGALGNPYQDVYLFRRL